MSISAHQKLAKLIWVNPGMIRHQLGTTPSRWYSEKSGSNSSSNCIEDWSKLRPMIKKRIAYRSQYYPIKSMINIARLVLRSRSDLFNGVASLLRHVPTLACKFCPEVYIGETGHLIKTCCGFKNRNKNQCHQWIRANINDICVPVETFHLERMFQDEIQHHQRFDFDRIPAVVELCLQAGAYSNDLNLQSHNDLFKTITDAYNNEDHPPLPPNELQSIANKTLTAWEVLRQGVQKLLLAYPVKVCKHCSEVHVGPSGHKARFCGLFKYQSWRGAHFWEKASVDDLVPPKIVWHRRPQDPPILVDEGRDYYGHAPAVVDLCSKAGVVVPTKYFGMMKVQGLTLPSSNKIST